MAYRHRIRRKTEGHHGEWPALNDLDDVLDAELLHGEYRSLRPLDTKQKVADALDKLKADPIEEQKFAALKKRFDDVAKVKAKPKPEIPKY